MGSICCKNNRSKKEKPTVVGAYLLSDDTLVQILLRVQDPKTLANCALADRRLATILASSSSFWVTKCKFDKKTIPTALSMTRAGENTSRIDYRLIWRKNPYGRNLIKNDSERFDHWDIKPAIWDQDQRMAGGGVMHPIEKAELGDGDFEWRFATSHFKCEKKQLVDLWEEGVQPWILDEMKPDIVVSELHTGRSDCGSKYGIDVSLLDDNMDEMGENFMDTCVEKYGESGKWKQSLHRFVGYPAGVRYVSFASWGHDTFFWSGFFGAKMTKAEVTLEFN